VGGGVLVQLQGSREGVEHLRGGMLVTALLETDVVVGADAGEHRYLLAPQSGRAAARGVPKADVLGLDEFAACSEVLADHVRGWHAVANDTTPAAGQPGGATTRIRRSLVGAVDRLDTDRMTENTVIHTGFGAESTIWDVVEGIDLSGRRAIVTGASSGIGVETVRALAATGAEVMLAVRDTAAGERTAVDIRATTGNQAVRVGRLDLAELDSVSAFIAAWDGPLHLLINNAGVMALPSRELTDHGWELQFATNHVGHFALTVGLHDALAAGAQSDGEARIVSLSSRGHLRSPVVFDDLHFSERPYDPQLAYGQSKTANVLLAVEVHRRWSREGINANAVHPGAIFETNLSRHMSPDVLERVWSEVRERQAQSGAYGLKTREQGAATSVLLATSQQLYGIGGRYFEDCNQAQLLPADFSPETASGVAPYALDPDNAARLWELSERLITNTR
jgi:NAD(P)-dependent dehydrogenase (short-subunit alcohol dehydrogenase family)